MAHDSEVRVYWPTRKDPKPNGIILGRHSIPTKPPTNSRSRRPAACRPLTFLAVVVSVVSLPLSAGDSAFDSEKYKRLIQPLLKKLGLDSEKRTYRFQKRDFRLTDVGDHVLQKLLS